MEAGTAILSYDGASARRGRFAGLSLGIMFAYPVALVGCFYLTWAVGRMALGHWPRPSLDDPKYISTWVDVVYNATMMLVMGFPAGLAGGVISAIWFGWARNWRVYGVAALMVCLLGLWAGAIAFLRWDPLGVVNWFMD